MVQGEGTNPQAGKVTVDEFAAKIKEKYPEYKDVDNLKLAQSIVEKYPEYKEVVVFEPTEPVKKKDGNIPSASLDGESPSFLSEVNTFFQPTYDVADWVNKNIPVWSAWASISTQLAGGMIKAVDGTVKESILNFMPDSEYKESIKKKIQEEGIDKAIDTPLEDIAVNMSQYGEEIKRGRLDSYGISEEEQQLGIIGNITSGNLSAAATLALDGTVEGIIQSGLAALTGVAPLAISAGGEKYYDVSNKPNYSSSERILYSSAVGLMEGLIESVFASDIKAFGKVLDSEIAIKGFEKELLAAAKKTPWYKEFLKMGTEEGLEESLSESFGQMLTGFKEGTRPDPIAIAEAFVMGFLPGAGTHVITNGISAIGSERRTKRRQELAKRIEETKAKAEEVEDPSQKAILEEMAKDDIDELNKEIGLDAELYAGFSEEDVNEIQSINTEIRNLYQKIGLAVDEDQKNAYKKQILDARSRKLEIENRYSEEPVRYIRDGRLVTKAQFVDMVNNATPEELSTGQWGVENDSEVEQLLISRLPQETIEEAKYINQDKPSSGQVDTAPEPDVKLSKPYKTVNDGSGKMVTVTTETTEKEGIKKTKFKTETTNKKGEPRTQNNKGYNTFEEAVENLDIDLESEENEAVLELVEELKKSGGKETIPARVVEIREVTDKSSPFFGKKVATVVVGAEKLNFVLTSKPAGQINEAAAEGAPATDVTQEETAVEDPARQMKVDLAVQERAKPEYVERKVSQLPVEDTGRLSQELEGEFGLLTAENPMRQTLTEEENAELNKKAEAWLKKRDYTPRRVSGKYGQAENSFFVPGLTKEDAIEFAKEFNQESVAHSEGLIYQDGSVNPRDKSKDDFSLKGFDNKSDEVSVVNTTEGPKTFKVGYDFATKVEQAPAKPAAVEGAPATDVTQEETAVEDRLIPLKREVIRVKSDDGTYEEYTVTTMLDGSLKADSVSYDENGNEIGRNIGLKLADNDIIKRDGLTSLDAVKLSAGEGDVVTVESTQSGEDFMNPKKKARLTSEQKKKLGIEVTEEVAEETTEELDIILLDEQGGEKELSSIGGSDPRNIQIGKMTVVFGKDGLTFKTDSDTGRMKRKGGEMFIPYSRIETMPGINKYEKGTKEYAYYVAGMESIADPYRGDPVELLESRLIKPEDLGKKGTGTEDRFSEEDGKRIASMIRNFNKLSKKFGRTPTKIVFGNSLDIQQYYRYLTGEEKKSSTQGTYSVLFDTIFINTSSADIATVAHELTHAYIQAVNLDPKKIVEFTNILEAELAKGTSKEVKLGKELGRFRDEYVNRKTYGEKTKDDPIVAEEFLAEYVGRVFKFSEDLSPSNQVSFVEKVRKAVIKFLAKLGVVDKNLVAKIETREEALSFINGFLGALEGRVTIEPSINKTANPNQAQRSRLQIEAPAGSKLFNTPLEDATTLARQYMDSKGLEYKEGSSFNELDEKRAKRISDAYIAMKDEPTNPAVAAAYNAMAEETLEQYELISKAGYTVEMSDKEYDNSAQMIADLRDNKRMRIFSTEAGFGDDPITAKQRSENPLLQTTKYKDVNGEPLLVNDVFRFVHDFFGHAKRGNSFGPKGEENAWDVHSRMYTPLARRAMTSETRGQNSYVNFSGVNAEAFKLRDKARELRKEGKFAEAKELTNQVYGMMKFADQKVGLLPDEFVENPYDNAPSLLEEEEQGDAGEVGTINIPRQQIEVINAPKLSEDNRSFVQKFVTDIKMTALQGRKFVTNMYDYTNTGVTNLGNGLSITLFGGRNYVPMMMERNGAELGDVSNLAAFNSKEQAEGFIRNATKGKADLFGPHSGGLEGSWQFQHHIFESLVNLVLDNKILSKSELIELFNTGLNTKGPAGGIKAFEKFNERNKTKLKNLNRFKKNPLELVELLNAENNYSPNLRKILNQKIASNKKFQKAIGVKNLNEFHNRISDPLNIGVSGGEIMTFVEFDPSTFKIVKTKPGDANHHPSFGWVVMAKIKAIHHPDKYYKSYDITDSYTKHNVDGTVVEKKSEVTEKEFIESNVKSSAGAIAKIAEVDVPREQIDFAGIEMKVKETPGNTDPAIKTGGTAYVPVSTLYNLMDMRDGDRGGLYETARDKKRVDEIAERFKKEGYNSNDGWYQPIYIDIDAAGFGWIGEGNHRVLAAMKLGMTHLPVKVEFGAARDGKYIYHKNYSRVPTQVVTEEKIEQLKEQAGKYYHIKYASIWETNLPTNPEPSRDVTREQIDWESSEFGRGQVNPAIVNRTTEVQQAVIELLQGKITNSEYQETVRITQPIEAITRFFLPASTKDMMAALDSNKGKLLNVTLKDGTEIGLRLDIPAYKNRNIWVVSIHDKGASGKSLSYGSVAWATDVTFGSNPKVASFIAAGKNLDLSGRLIAKSKKVDGKTTYDIVNTETNKVIDNKSTLEAANKFINNRQKQDKTTIARMLGKWKNFEGKTKEEKDASAVKKIEEIVAIENSYPGAGRKGSPWRQIGMNPFRHSFFYDRRNGQPVIAAAEVVQIGGLVYAKDVVYADKNDPIFNVEGYKDANGETVRFQIEDQANEEANNEQTYDAVESNSQGLFDADVDAAVDAEVSEMDSWKERPRTMFERFIDLTRLKIQDKFRKLIAVQEDIEFSKGAPVGLDEDFRNAEALMHGKAKEELNKTEIIVGKIAKLIKASGLSIEKFNDLLYAMHAQERNRYLRVISTDIGKSLMAMRKKKGMKPSEVAELLGISTQDYVDIEANKTALKTSDLADVLLIYGTTPSRFFYDNAKVKDGSGMTDVEARKILAEYGLDLTSPDVSQLKPRIAVAVQAVRDLTADTRNRLLESGLETQATIDAFTATYKNYVPLRGFADGELQSEMIEGGRRLEVRGREKRAKGRTTKADSPLTQVIISNTTTIVRAEKNSVMNRFYNLAVSNPNKDVYEVVDPKVTKEYKREIRNGKIVTTAKTIADYMSDPNMVSVRVGGEYKFIRFKDASLADALNGANVVKADWMVKYLGAFNRALSSFITTYDPEFVLRNFSRDIQTAVLNLFAEQEMTEGLIKDKSIVAKVVKDVWPAIKSIAIVEGGKSSKNKEMDQYYREFKEDGAKTEWFYSKSSTEVEKDIKNLIEGKGDTALQAAGNLVERINSAVENGVRLSAYVNARKAGVSRSKSAELAKNLTVNFNKSGEWGQIGNTLFLFFNASVQGTSRLMRSLKPQYKVDSEGNRSLHLTTAQKMAIGLSIMGSIVSVLNEIGSDDDEDDKSFYSKIPDFEKERNIIIMKWRWLGGDGKGYWKIPLPYGVNVFYVAGTLLADASQKIKTPGEVAGGIMQAAIGSFSPINFPNSDDTSKFLMKFVTPTIGQVPLGLAINENYFGQTIYNENFPFDTSPKPESELGRKGGNRWTKELTRLLNKISGGSEFRGGEIDINPDKIDFVMESYSGGMGKFVSRSANTIDKIITGNWDQIEPRQVPFLRVFYGQSPKYVNVQDFYTRSILVNQMQEEVKAGIISGAEAKRVSKVFYLGKNIRKQLSALKKREDAVMQIKDADVQREKMKKLEELRYKLVADYNKQYERFEIDKLK